MKKILILLAVLGLAGCSRFHPATPSRLPCGWLQERVAAAHGNKKTELPAAQYVSELYQQDLVIRGLVATKKDQKLTLTKEMLDDATADLKACFKL